MANASCQSILIIEDDEPIRNAIQQALEFEGYTVLVAGDGLAALEILRTVPRPCLILLDLMLPIMNGWEFLEEIKSAEGSMLAAIPVVITSAAGDAARTAKEKAQGFIKKPIDLDLLLTSVQKYCGPGSMQLPKAV